MKVGQIADEMDKLYPHYLAEKWDNVGLLCGNRESEIKKILVSLDATLDVIGEAIVLGVNMIITHHPILFGGIKKVTIDNPDGKIIYSLIKNNISLYAAHTNLDSSENGISRYEADLIGLEGTSVLVPHENIIGSGMGVIGYINQKKDMKISEFAEWIKKILNVPHLKFTGSPDRKVRKVAVVTGSGGDFIKEAVQAGADVLITGDIKYHMALDAELMGISIIDAGHYATEIVAVDIFEKNIKSIAPDIKIIKSTQKDVFNFV